MSDELVEALRDANGMFKEKFENAYASAKWVHLGAYKDKYGIRVEQGPAPTFQSRCVRPAAQHVAMILI
eukprot:4233258-Karenia_brevis.AAC.1